MILELLEKAAVDIKNTNAGKAFLKIENVPTSVKHNLPFGIVSMLSTINQLHMLDNVRRVGIGLSGGADSLALLEAITILINSGYLPNIDMVPIHINQYMNLQKVARLEEFVHSRYGLTLQVFTADTRDTAAKLLQQGKAPCRGCAPIRARILAEASSDLQLNALAVGHHLNDAMATLLMNIFHKGKIETMQPIAFRKHNRAIPILRPFYFTEEKQVKDICPVGPEGLFDCGMCDLHASERARATLYVEETFKQHGISSHFAQEVLQSLLYPNNGLSNSKHNI